jgi:hypothetical protein
VHKIHQRWSGCCDASPQPEGVDWIVRVTSLGRCRGGATPIIDRSFPSTQQV